MKRFVRITHRPTGAILAEGPIGWGITPFEGNYYVRRKYLRSGVYTTSFVPGLCPYKFVYAWLHLDLPSGRRDEFIAWRYWLPNPLFPFIWYRVAFSGTHPHLDIQRWNDSM